MATADQFLALRHLFGGDTNAAAVAEAAAVEAANLPFYAADTIAAGLVNPANTIRMLTLDEDAGTEFLRQRDAMRRGQGGGFLARGTGVQFHPSAERAPARQAALQQITETFGPAVQDFAESHPRQAKLGMDLLNNKAVQGSAQFLGVAHGPIRAVGRSIGRGFKESMNAPSAFEEAAGSLLLGKGPTNVSMANIIKTPPGTRPYFNRVRTKEISPKIIGTGKINNKIILPDVGLHLDEQYFATHGRELNMLDPVDRAIVKDQMLRETSFMLSQEKGGIDWYTNDVAKFIMDGSRIMPILATSPAHQVLLTAIVAPLSSGMNPIENGRFAIDGFQAKMLPGGDGKIPLVKPFGDTAGAKWSRRPSVAMSYAFINWLEDEMGLEDAMAWLLTPHPIKELREARLDSGVYKTHGIAGKMNDELLGAFAFGPKAGPFFLNTNGFEDFFTTDAWMNRRFHRITSGRVSDPNSPTGLRDSPTARDRVAGEQLAQEVADELGLKRSQVQATDWFGEIMLYNDLGINVKPEKFSEGSKKAISLRRGNAPEVGSFPKTNIPPSREIDLESVRPAQQLLRHHERRFAAQQNQQQGLVLGLQQPNAETFIGIHFSQSQVSTLIGSHNGNGTGIPGEEQKRLRQSNDPRIKRRVYFYIPHSRPGRHPPEQGLGPQVHAQRFDNILNADSEAGKAIAREADDPGMTDDQWFNAMESATVDAGYDGLAVPELGMMVILDHDVPVVDLGTRGDLEQAGVRVNRNREALLEHLETNFPEQ